MFSIDTINNNKNKENTHTITHTQITVKYKIKSPIYHETIIYREMSSCVH